MLALEFKIALRYLKSKNKQKFISIISTFSFIAVTLSVAILIIVTSVMNGFREKLISEILNLESHITIYAAGNGNNEPIKNGDVIISSIKPVKAIKILSPVVQTQALIIYRGKASGVSLKGINSATLKSKLVAYTNLDQNSQQDFDSNDKNSILLGSVLAKNLGVAKGDEIKIITPNVLKSIIGVVMPRYKKFKVIGLINSEIYEYNSVMAFAPLSQVQDLLGYKNNEYSALELTIDNPENIDVAKDQISKQSKFIREGRVAMSDWRDFNKAFIDALKIEKAVMFLILTSIIMIAAFNIMTSLVMMVNEKERSIAVFRAMGLCKKSIIRIFTIYGVLIGVTGALLGTLLGTLFSYNIESIRKFIENITGWSLFNPVIYFFYQLPAKVSLIDVSLITSLTMILAVLATIYPAYKAGSKKPAAALRME